MKTVLVIASSDDSIVDYITSIYSRKCCFFRLDVDRMSDYNFQLNNYGWCIDSYRKVVTDRTVDAIYHRKPSSLNFEKYDEGSQERMKKSIAVLIAGITSTFEGKCLTKSSVLERAENKIYQMYLANKVGLSMPKSLIANKTRDIITFEEKHKCAIKNLSVSGKTTPKYSFGRKTHIAEFTEFPQGIEICPEFFQQVVTPEYEVKANYICGKYYTVKIRTVKKTKGIREELITYSDMVLPKEVKEKCNKLMKGLGLECGEIHFIVKGGEYYFLEVNPNGNWLRSENEFGWNLSADIVEYLCQS